MEEILPKHTNIMVIGDFIIHINDDKGVTLDFKDSLSTMGLIQHVVLTSVHTSMEIPWI